MNMQPLYEQEGSMDEETVRGLISHYKEKLDTKRKVGETTARASIIRLRMIGNQVPIFPALLAIADEMEMLLNEVLRYRKEKK